jgi:putative transposase
LPIGALCAEHEISQAQYYQWRDQFLANAAKAFEPAGAPQRQGRFERENARLKNLVRRAHPGAQKKRGDPRMRRGPYPKVAARNTHLLERIRALKADHPFWGYRRIWAYLRYVDGLIVNQKPVDNGMKAAGLLVRPNPKLRAQRKAPPRNRARPGPTTGGAST